MTTKLKVVIDTTFSGPIKGVLHGTRKDSFFNRKVAVVTVTKGHGPYHEGEVAEVDPGDVFLKVTFSGINTITYSGKPDWSDVPDLGPIEYLAEGSLMGRWYTMVRVTPMEPTDVYGNRNLKVLA